MCGITGQAATEQLRMFTYPSFKNPFKNPKIWEMDMIDAGLCPKNTHAEGSTRMSMEITRDLDDDHQIYSKAQIYQTIILGQHTRI